MNKVAVTVFLPVYNGEKYVKQAIDSILAQTYQDFELLVIDDCSTDASRSIIQSYNDARIRLLTNTRNLGLIRTLNLGLTAAQGEYIARMDQDDIAEPERLQQQSDYLTSHPSCAVVASTVRLINPDGIVTGEWDDDVQHLTSDQIRRYLPIANCLAHPAMMGRASILKRYGYSADQVTAEDYDLWLRLAADHQSIEKIAQPLLRYRIHAASMTQQSKHQTGSGKNTKTKGRFLKRQLQSGKVNAFFFNVAAQYCKDIARWLGLSLVQFSYRLAKKIIRKTGYHIGTWLGRFHVISNPSGYWFIFHSYGIGGAESVHAQIITAVPVKNPLIIFTLPTNTTKTVLDLYTKVGTVLDISKPVSSIFGYSIYLGILAYHINRQPHPVVFGSVSSFFYELLPHLQPQVQTIDLTHAFDGASEHLTIQFVPYLKHRIVINQTIYQDLLTHYAAYHLPPHYQDRLRIIENGVTVPTTYTPRSRTPFQVVYLGRGTYEKRVHLIGEIAKRCHQAKLKVQFTLVGNIPDTIVQQYRDYCSFKREITDPSAKQALFNQAHILMMTSSREGFPITIMEAMSHGVVPLVTNVGGIRHHVHHNTNGLLVDNLNESYVITTMTDYITHYSQHATDWERLSNHAYSYTIEHFSLANFQQRYQELFRSVEHS